MLKPLHFVERLCVTDVGDVEPFYLPQGSLIVVEPRRKNPTKSYVRKVTNLQLVGTTGVRCDRYLDGRYPVQTT